MYEINIAYCLRFVNVYSYAFYVLLAVALIPAMLYTHRWIEYFSPPPLLAPASDEKKKRPYLRDGSFCLYTRLVLWVLFAQYAAQYILSKLYF